jgi:hypothetical protein
MSNIFDAVSQVYEYIQAPDVVSLLDGRIYQHNFPSEGETIGEGFDRFIVINTLELKPGQIIKEVPVNIQVFVKKKDKDILDYDNLDALEKAIDAALDLQDGSKVTGYGAIEKVFGGTLLPENPHNNNYSLLVFRINLIINAK